MEVRIITNVLMTAAGNAAVKGRDISGLWPHASVFVPVKIWRFFTKNDDGSQDIVARDLNEWLQRTASECRGFRLHTAPLPPLRNPTWALKDWMRRGPRWLIEVVGTTRSEFWESNWYVVDRNLSAQKVWGIAFVRQSAAAPDKRRPKTIGGCADALQGALVQAESFARELHDEAFEECFRKAIETLAREYDGKSYRLDEDFTSYAELEPPALQLFRACSSGWVFGGMGSWNDRMPYDDGRARFEEVTDRVYNALLDSIIAVANSSYTA